jgi:hypothetical protein
VSKSKIALPEHEFFYTLDQVALILSVKEAWLRDRCFFVGRMPGERTKDLIQVINLEQPNKHPKWRVGERELKRWLARQGHILNDER